jgi:hypothetical protein
MLTFRTLLLAYLLCAQHGFASAQPSAQVTEAPSCIPTIDTRSASRTLNEVRKVFECNAPLIYSKYRELLREKPGTSGQLVFELQLEASGQVSACRLLSSTMQAPEFERTLISTLLTFNFGAKDAPTLVLKYPVEFRPE